ncbi:methyltransferase domain-containing protein [Nocardia sp. NPDC004340]
MSGEPNAIGEILVTSRSLAEYQAMFGLSDADLRASILDCPAGAAGFVAEINSRGGDALACDPVYAERDPAETTALALSDIDRANQYLRSHADQYAWTFFTDPDHHRQSRSEAARRFGTDIAAHPARYIAAALPSLPFADASFDLVLSSHFLFSYADRFDLNFHLRAILELIRVSRREVRIFPLTPMGAPHTYRELPALIDSLTNAGITTAIKDVDYEFQRLGTQMLVCTREVMTD